MPGPEVVTWSSRPNGPAVVYEYITNTKENRPALAATDRVRLSETTADPEGVVSTAERSLFSTRTPLPAAQGREVSHDVLGLRSSGGNAFTLPGQSLRPCLVASRKIRRTRPQQILQAAQNIPVRSGRSVAQCSRALEAASPRQQSTSR